jgi:hypothetical protein
MKSFKSYSLNLLNNRQLAFVAGTDNLIKFHLSNPNWFTSEYQSRSKKSNPEYYSLGFIIEAVHNSEKTFEQYPKDEPKLKKLARSIFDEQHWLIKDVTIAFLEHKPYIIGGRHRIDAIANVLSQLVRACYRSPVWEDEYKEELFQKALDQNIRVEVLHLSSKDDLLTLINMDNESRKIRKVEKAHMLAQSFGADSSSIESLTEPLLTSDLNTSEVLSIASQNFARRPHNKLTNQTKCLIGEKVAKYVLYGIRPDVKISPRQELKTTNAEQFETLMDIAWEITKEVITGKVIVARHISSLANEIIDRLEELKNAA